MKMRDIGGTFVASLTLAHVLCAAPVTSGLQLWLDAADSTTIRDASNDQPGDGGFDDNIATWQDKSGNNNHATASGQLPTYSGGAFNGQGAVTFNPTNAGAVMNTQQFFSLTSNIATARETMFFAIKMFDNGDNQGVWVGGSGNQFTNDNNRYFISVAAQNGAPVAAAAPQGQAGPAPNVVTETRNPGSAPTGQATFYKDGLNAGVVTGSHGDPLTGTLTLNRVGTAPSSGRYFYGQMSEVLIYNSTFNTAQRTITENYLSSKYGNAMAADDHYLGDTAGNAEHDFDVFGIGQDAASTLSPAGDLTASSGDAISLTELNTSLADGEYLLAGHNTTAHGFTTADVPLTAITRSARDYYLDATGTLDARLTFDFSLAGLGTPSAAAYTLLYRTGTSGTYTDIGLIGSISGSSVSFDLLGLNNSGDGFYTIASAPEPGSAACVVFGFAVTMGLNRPRARASRAAV